VDRSFFQCLNIRFWNKVTFQRLFSPVKRAGGLAGFEVLSGGDRNAHCLSDLTLANCELNWCLKIETNFRALYRLRPVLRTSSSGLTFLLQCCGEAKKDTRHRRNAFLNSVFPSTHQTFTIPSAKLATLSAGSVRCQSKCQFPCKQIASKNFRSNRFIWRLYYCCWQKPVSPGLERW
jgi:hypothetical protein